MPIPRRSLLTLVALSLAGCGGGGADSDAQGASSASPTSSGPTSATAGSAIYRVTLRNHWTAAEFPTRFPSSAHLTGVVGATHSERIDFWAVGGLATVGIKNVAERGVKADLLSEAAQAMAAGTAETALSGAGVPLGASEVSLEFTINPSHPRVTLISMLGPSPDWFTGVAGLSLLRDGQWLARVDMPLRVYDAGTDDGASFTSPDVVTAPPRTIQPLTTAAADSDLQDGMHRSTGTALASILFERLA